MWFVSDHVTSAMGSLACDFRSEVVSNTSPASPQALFAGMVVCCRALRAACLTFHMPCYPHTPAPRAPHLQMARTLWWPMLAAQTVLLLVAWWCTTWTMP